MDEITVLSPELDRGSGGLADHTRLLLDAWKDRGRSFRVLSPTAANRDIGVSATVEKLTNPGRIQDQLPRHAGKLLVQYSAYGFDRYGYPRQLLRALRRWKSETDGVLVLLFHEIWGFWPVLNKNTVLQWLHRRDIGKLIGCADSVFTTTSSQAAYLRRLSSGKSIDVLPVGSNIQRVGSISPGRQPGQAVLFGLAETRLRTVRKMKRALAELAAAGRLTNLVTVGATNDRDRKDEAGELAQLRLSAGFEQYGPASHSRISELMVNSSFGISAQDQLSYEKSGTFMAYAAHELNVLNQHGGPTESEPLCWVVTPAELLSGISAEELRARAQHLCRWQQQTSSWDVIASRLGQRLGLGQPQPAAQMALG